MSTVYSLLRRPLSRLPRVSLLRASAATIDARAAARRASSRSTATLAGTIVVRTSERRLYFVLGDGRALGYPVGVGRAGRQWSGRATIDGKHVKPAWPPPPTSRASNPNLPGSSPAARRAIRWASPR